MTEIRETFDRFSFGGMVKKLFILETIWYTSSDRMDIRGNQLYASALLARFRI